MTKNKKLALGLIATIGGLAFYIFYLEDYLQKKKTENDQKKLKEKLTGSGALQNIIDTGGAYNPILFNVQKKDGTNLYYRLK